MENLNKCLNNAAVRTIGFMLFTGLAFTAPSGYAQMSMPANTPAQAQTTGQDTQTQITALRQQVVKLQAALRQSRAGKPVSGEGMAGGKPGMGMRDGSGEMGGMSSGGEMEQMNGMAPPSGGMKSGAMKPKGCCGMSMGKPMAGPPMKEDMTEGRFGGGAASMKEDGMSDKPMPSATGQQTPSLLHLGAKDFFLDHQQHIGMTSDQKMRLEMLKNDALQHQTSSQAKIDHSEQDLWQLTSADQPDSAAIDHKVSEVAKLRADEQMAFIHSVSMASDVLTPDQRTEVLMPMSPAKGMKAPMAKKPMTSPMKMQ